MIHNGKCVIPFLNDRLPLAKTRLIAIRAPLARLSECDPKIDIYFSGMV